MLGKKEISDYLKELRIEATNLEKIELKDISSAFKKLALILHPDKAGENSKNDFQKLRAAYEKLYDHFIESEASNSPMKNDFFNDNFKHFNFPFENRGSFTVKIEDALSTIWNDCISQSLGLPLIKANGKGTETDRYWKLNYQYGDNVELTIHLYIKPKNKKGSKLLVQGGVQAAICAYVFNELPSIYAKVCEAKSKLIAV